MERIRAAICHTFGAPLEIGEIAIRGPETGELEVTVKAVAICHSDISFAEGAWGGTLPAVFGHEAAGVVSKVGPGVSGFAVGDPVVVTLIRACGTCVSCVSGAPTICLAGYDGDHGPITTLDGGVLHQAMAVGGFAEKVVVDQSQTVKIPGDMDFAAASLLGCGVITGVGAVVHAARLRAGEDVVVIGAGGVGLNAIQGARIAGARRIVAVDRLPEKLEDAKAFGATDGVLADDGAPWKAVRKILGRGADVVTVTVGAIPAYDQGLKYLGFGGRLIMVGMPHAGAMAQYEPAAQSFMGQTLKGSKMGDVVIQRDIPWMVDLHRQGRLKLDELISRRWAFSDINAAIADTKAGKARRNVIEFP